MTQQTIILLSVFAYFGVGALFAIALNAITYGFSGRFEPMSILFFFAWPFMLVLRVPYAIFVLGALAAAGLMTWGAWLLLRSLS